MTFYQREVIVVKGKHIFNSFKETSFFLSKGRPKQQNYSNSGGDKFIFVIFK